MIAALVALASLAALSPLALNMWPGAIAWSLSGWLILAAVGAADGVWLNLRYGQAGSGFLLAMVTGMLARMLVVGIGTFLAFRAGEAAPWAFLAGVAAGFVPLQVFEVIWFLRLGREQAKSYP